MSQILYEDEAIIVVRKSAGIAVQTARLGQQDVVSELKNYLCRGGGGGRGEPYLGVIHRLDQPVEGILVFAKTKACAAFLTAQLQKQGDESAFCKGYYAVLCGIPDKREGRLSDYLYKQTVKNGKYTDYRAVVIGRLPENGDCTESLNRRGDRAHRAGKNVTCAEKARRAVLEYRILQTLEEQGLSLADIRIHTGRFHQIRAQMAYGGMPLLGDMKYGSPETEELARRLGVQNVALCACRLGFVHPVSGEKMDFRIKPENPAFSSFSQL
ncbi:MAG: RluA family pseudouridine synthase [Lachnospiraceae bacterium]|nr:RluA family pseudouridine synthase [Lachnospiraceae bacterium]